MGVGSQRHAPAALPLEKDPVPMVSEAGWAPGPVWTPYPVLSSKMQVTLAAWSLMMGPIESLVGRQLPKCIV
jgi:hypothetical protein